MTDIRFPPSYRIPDLRATDGMEVCTPNLTLRASTWRGSQTCVTGLSTLPLYTPNQRTPAQDTLSFPPEANHPRDPVEENAPKLLRHSGRFAVEILLP